MENNTEANKKRELILGDDFENALISAAEVQNDSISLCKERNKNNYMGFYDIMLGSRVDVQEAMNKKGKNKTTEDNEKIKEFKVNTSKTYKTLCEYIFDVEKTNKENKANNENKENKIQKAVKNIALVLQTMRYIGNTIIDDEFKKYGIELKQKKLEEEHDMFSQDHIKDTMKQIFDNGKSIKCDIMGNKSKIENDIYDSSVPTDLQFDKEMNPTGIKKSDFCKIVDLKAKLLKAKDEEAKDKVKMKVEKIASEYVFQNERNEIINKKVTELSV